MKIIIFVVLSFFTVFVKSQSSDPELRAILSKQIGLGEPCSNRNIWGTLSLSTTMMTAASNYKNQAMRAWSNATYFEYSQTGNRANSDTMMAQRVEPLRDLVLAECVNYRGEFLPKIEEYLNELAKQPSWAFSAHDKDFSYINGKYFVELGSVSVANSLSQAYYMLKDKLSITTKTNVLNALEARILSPMRKMFANDAWIKSKHFWENSEDNWNPVCWNGATLTALVASSSQTDRDFFITKAFSGVKSFLNGFRPDGYYSEGIGYFNYGFGALINLRQVVMEATSGTYDFFLSDPKIPQYAAFAIEFPMSGNNGAMFGDDNSGGFTNGVVNYIESTVGSDPTPNYNDSCLDSKFLGYVMLFNLKYNVKNRYPIANRITLQKGIRKYYSTSGILVCRPSSGNGLAATFKFLGGGLGPSGGHNHDDAGSYSIMLNGVRVAGDVGGPKFYEGIWSDRYNLWIHNSFSHPVPVVNGKLQVRNTVYNLMNPQPKVWSTSFTDSTDSISFFLNFAYNDPALVDIKRTNTYNRTPGSQSVTIKDEVVFNKPAKFETGISSLGTWKETSKLPKELSGTFTYQTATINVKVKSLNDIDYKMNIASQGGVNFTRLGVYTVNLSLNDTFWVVYS